MQWYVLCTKNRKEKYVTKYLKEAGIEVYCPLISRKRTWSDRIKIVEEPLFPSYCFVQIKDSDRANVFIISGIVRYLYWLGKPAIIKESEIEQIKFTLNQFDHSLIRIETLTLNDKVTINSGIFSGETGTVINKQGENILIQIDSLQIRIKANIADTVIMKQ